MKDLKEKVVRGGLAKMGTQLVNLSLRLGSLAILARLLEPKDFEDAGLSMATIQRHNVDQKQLSTLFWINVMVGATLALMLILSSPFIAEFYKEPRLQLLSVIISIEFLFIGISAQHSALLQRQMSFSKIALIDIISQMSGVAVAINMAVNGWGYWSLVGQSITTAGIGALCTWEAVRWMPNLPSRNVVGVLSMLRFGGLVTLNNLVVYIAYNLEKVLLGRFWGAEVLGIYTRSFQLISIPTDALNSSVFSVAFSALSRIQNDPVRQNNYFLKGYSLLLAITLPITIACAVFADDIIFILLGSKWKDSVIIFQLLAPTILIFALINPFAWLLYSTGRAERSLKLAFVIAPLVIGAYIIGLPYGPKGVALAYSTAMGLWVIPHIAWCIHGTGISGRDMLHSIMKPFLSGIVAAVLALLTKNYFDFVMPNLPLKINLIGIEFGNQTIYRLLKLFVSGFIMIVFYLWMLLYVMNQKKFYVGLIRGMRKRHPAP
jgi:PST family polysaccharide transporter